jgi:hypothetical protein
MILHAWLKNAMQKTSETNNSYLSHARHHSGLKVPQTTMYYCNVNCNPLFYVVMGYPQSHVHYTQIPILSARVRRKLAMYRLVEVAGGSMSFEMSLRVRSVYSLADSTIQSFQPFRFLQEH